MSAIKIDKKIVKYRVQKAEDKTAAEQPTRPRRWPPRSPSSSPRSR